MTKVLSNEVLLVAPIGFSAPDSITMGGGSLWVEYGNGASSTGGGTSTIVQYSMNGRIEHIYTAAGLADGLKYDPYTGQVWVLDNNNGNSALQFIDPVTNQISTPLSYAPPYSYGTASSRGFDDVVFAGQTVFMSESNPVNSGDPVVVELTNGTAPFGKLYTSTILSLGDMGINLTTGKLALVPITDPDSLKALPDGSLLLTGEADGAYVFIKHPGTSQQTVSFVTLPSGYTPDDAIMPGTSSGTFYISNQSGNSVQKVQISGLVATDLYADITNKNELVQIDPNTGKVTTVLTGLSSPHGMVFVPTPPAILPTVTKSAAQPAPPTTDPQALSSFIFASAPAGDTKPDSITIGGGSMWVEYGNGANSAGGGTSKIVQYSMNGQVQATYTANGLADGLKYDPVTGNVWVMNNNDGNANLQFIDPRTAQISGSLTYAAPYVYGANSGSGYDDAVFEGQRVFISKTNPANPGDAVVQELLNGTAPFGKLQTSTILSYGDSETNILTGKTEMLPVSDPDSLKALPDGALMLTSEADGALTFIKHPGTSQQTASFLKLPAGYTPDDAIMPAATSGTFYISNEGANNVLKVQVKDLIPSDIYADIYSKNELVQIDPTNGKITTVLAGLSNPHGLAFVASSPRVPFDGHTYL